MAIRTCKGSKGASPAPRAVRAGSGRLGAMSLVCTLRTLDDRDIVALEGDHCDESEIDGGRALDLDKAWHGIHFLMTGSGTRGRAPLDFLRTGRRWVPSVDVRKIRDALAMICDEDLCVAFDPVKMTELRIYPGIWDRSGEEADGLDYLLAHVRGLRAFLDDAVRDGRGMLVDLG